ncbi:MAG TPA: hypothetical protein VEB63_03110 [Chitinophagaceae bacterium]|nr:hypothetical protein [Chitinophagaceae bacterium]
MQKRFEKNFSFCTIFHQTPPGYPQQTVHTTEPGFDEFTKKSAGKKDLLAEILHFIKSGRDAQ